MKQVVLAISVAMTLAGPGCGTKAHEPAGSFAALFGSTKAPALAGPLAKVRWGMPYPEAIATDPRKLDAGTLHFSFTGMGEPPVLAGITVKGSGEDPRPVLADAWGSPYADFGGVSVWVSPEATTAHTSPYGDATRAVASADAVTLTPYHSLAHWLGAGLTFGFEADGVLTGLADADLEKRFAGRHPAGSRHLQLGYDEVDLVLVNFTLENHHVAQFSVDLAMPAAVRGVRSKLVLDRFGMNKVDASGTFVPLPDGVREVAILEQGEKWTVLVRPIVTP